MPRYTFWIGDSKAPASDPIEVDLETDEAARREAVRAIIELCKDALPDGDVRDFCAKVTDIEGNWVFEARLSFRSRWLTDGGVGQ